MGKSLLLLLLSLYSSLSLSAVRVSDSSEPPRFSLLPYLSYFFEDAAPLRPEDALNASFRAIDGHGITLFNTKPAWLKFDLDVATTGPVSLLVIGTASYLDKIELYQLEAGQAPRLLQKVGDRLADERTYRLPLFPLELRPGSYTFLMRIDTEGPLNAKFELWDQKLFDEEHRSWEYFGIGLLFGIVLVMAGYNAFLALRLRNEAYFFYVAYILLFAGVQFVFTGTAAHFLPSSAFKTFYINEGLVLEAELCAIFAGLFAISFLGLKKTDKRIVRAMYLFFVLSACNIVICFVDFNLSATLVLVTNGYISSLLFYAGIKRCLDRYRPAYFYSAAWVFIIIGSLITMGRIYGLLPDVPFTAWSQFVGGSIEVILLSLALGDKLSLEQERSHQEIIKLNTDLNIANEKLKEHIENVESIVEDQTRDIRSIMNHIPMGVFMIKSDQTVHKDYSRCLEDIVHSSKLDAKPAIDLIVKDSLLSSDERSQIASGLVTMIGEDLINFEMNSHILPLSLEKRAPDGSLQTFDLTWNTIESETGIVDKILVTIRDVTEIRHLQAKAEHQRDELEMIGEILNVQRARLLQFFENSRELLETSRILIDKPTFDHDDLRLLFIKIHTIKGSARALYFKRMTRAFHEFEQNCEIQMQARDSRVETLRSSWEEAHAIFEHYETVAREKLTITQNLQFETSSPATVRLAPQAVRPVREFCHELFATLPSLAGQLRKEIPHLSIAADGFLILPKAETLLSRVFIHILSNSMDHGIESVPERLTAKKSERATISLSMTREGNVCVIAFDDDGRGLDLVKIKASAEARGLIAPTTPMTPMRAAELIFEAGMSTAAEVSEISGRGVGMSAIKNFVEQEGGRVSIRIKEGTVSDPRFRAFSLVIELPFSENFSLAPKRLAAF